MKEIKQNYIIEMETLEKKLKEGDKGLIIDVYEETNTKYFKVISPYGEKNGIVITVKINSPDGETFTQWMSKPTDVRGLEKANMYLFKKKYGKVPQKGLEVDVKINENGFYNIVF